MNKRIYNFLCFVIEGIWVGLVFMLGLSYLSLLLAVLINLGDFESATRGADFVSIGILTIFEIGATLHLLFRKHY